jgi:hypothetical protein
MHLLQKYKPMTSSSKVDILLPFIRARKEEINKYVCINIEILEGV